MKIIKADQRFFNDIGWLKTYHLFSFADYYDPSNQEWGALRVFNDDYVEARNGFPMHPHRDFEILTIMLDGTITHTDSMGNKGSISRGEIQLISAGRGLYHSEVNQGDKDVHLYQIWFYPNVMGGIPSYGDYEIDLKLSKDALYPIVSGEGKSDISMNSDSTVYLSNLSVGKSLEHKSTATHKIFIYVGKGKLIINGTEIGQGDQLRDYGKEIYKIEAIEDSEFILIESV